jgi:hypothetical protein
LFQGICRKKLYKVGEFPKGQFYDLEALSSLKNGKIAQHAYFAMPMQFIDPGTETYANKGRDFSAKVSHTAFIRAFDEVTDNVSSKSLFKIIIPYPSPISIGSKYKFTTASPITVLSKEEKTDSDGKPFYIYHCIYQGYLTIQGITYPKH